MLAAGSGVGFWLLNIKAIALVAPRIMAMNMAIITGVELVLLLFMDTLIITCRRGVV